MRRGSILVGMLVVVVLALSVGSQAQVSTLTFWTHAYPPLVDLYEDLIAEYEAHNPGVDIQLVSYPAPELEPKLMAAVAGGSGPDIFRLPSWSTSAYVRMGMIDPVNPEGWGLRSQDEVVDLFVPQTLDAYIIDGRLYGIPYEINTLHVAYRKDFFLESGLDPESPPRTWNDLMTQGRHLVRRDPQGAMYRAAIGFPHANRIWTMHGFSPLLYQAGGSFLNEAGTRATVNTPQAELALDTYTAADARYGLRDQGFGANFLQDGAAMALAGPFSPGQFESANPRWEPDVTYGITPYFQLDPEHPIFHLYAIG